MVVIYRNLLKLLEKPNLPTLYNSLTYLGKKQGMRGHWTVIFTDIFFLIMLSYPFHWIQSSSVKTNNSYQQIPERQKNFITFLRIYINLKSIVLSFQIPGKKI